MAFSTAAAQTASDANEGSRLTHGSVLGSYDFSWWGQPGRTYFIQHSADLSAWEYQPLIDSGANGPLSRSFPSTAGLFFLRLRSSDIPTSDPFNADFDGDKVSNYAELRNGTDPLSSADTDGDGIPNDWETAYGLNRNNPADATQTAAGGGMTNLQHYQLGSNPNDPPPPPTITAGTAILDQSAATLLYPTDDSQLLLKNGNFSTPALGSDWNTYSGIPGWTAISGDLIELQKFSSLAIDGQFCELDSHWPPGRDHSQPSDHGIRQTVNLARGRYLLIFDYRGRYPGADSFTVNLQAGTASPVLLAAKNGAATTWKRGSTTFEVTGTNPNPTPITLLFDTADSEAKDSYGAYIDNVLLLPVNIAVDADRNGIIEFGKDTTSAQKPFRYWINEDHDHGENDDDLSGDANHSESIINGIRDLEDVTQVKFKIPQVLIDMAKAGTAQLGFKWKDVTQGSPSVRVWSGSPNIDKPDYLKDRDTAFQTLDENNLRVGSARLVSGTTSVWLRNSLMNDATIDTVNLLMEGVSVGVGKLTFMIKVGTQESEGPSIDFKLLNVRQMYERGKITVDAPGIPDPWDNPNPPALTWVWDPWNWQPDIDPNADQKTVAFVHGWRMPYNEYIQWADTTFKRFWQLGFKGRFYTFRWPTYHGQNDGISFADYTNTPGGLTYNSSEYRAWLSGPALANFVNGLPNGNARYLMAHSMGNVVAGSALRSNLQVTRYAMCNSAMAAMAYDATIIDNPFQTPDTDADVGTRQTFGLANKVNPAATEIVSFGLGPDRALGAWDANNQFFKPQVFGDGTYYVYVRNDPPGTKLRYLNWTPLPRFVTSVPEAMGYVTSSRSRAAGGKPETGGSVSSFVNMGVDGFEFGNEHSAQWVYSIQKTYPFWRRAAEEFNIDLTNR